MKIREIMEGLENFLNGLNTISVYSKACLISDVREDATNYLQNKFGSRFYVTSWYNNNSHSRQDIVIKIKGSDECKLLVPVVIKTKVLEKKGGYCWEPKPSKWGIASCSIAYELMRKDFLDMTIEELLEHLVTYLNEKESELIKDFEAKLEDFPNVIDRVIKSIKAGNPIKFSDENAIENIMNKYEKYREVKSKMASK